MKTTYGQLRQSYIKAFSPKKINRKYQTHPCILSHTCKNTSHAYQNVKNILSPIMMAHPSKVSDVKLQETAQKAL